MAGLDPCRKQAVQQDSPQAADMIGMINDHFAQVSRALSLRTPGHDAFSLLLRLLSSSLDSSYDGQSIEQLLMYHVPAGTPFDKYLRGFWELVTVTVDGGRELAPTQDMVMSVFRSSMSRQYPLIDANCFR